MKDWKEIREQRAKDAKWINPRSKYNLVECQSCGGIKSNSAEMCRPCYKKRDKTYRTEIDLTKKFRCLDCRSNYMPEYHINKFHNGHKIESFTSSETSSREKSLLKALGIPSKESLYIKKKQENWSSDYKGKIRIQKLNTANNKKEIDYQDYDDNKADCAYCLKPVPKDIKNPTTDECKHKRRDWNKVLNEERKERWDNDEWFGYHKSDWRKTMAEFDTDTCHCGKNKQKTSYQCKDCFQSKGGWQKSVKAKGDSITAQDGFPEDWYSKKKKD
jgi:hypothetical protein